MFRAFEAKVVKINTTHDGLYKAVLESIRCETITTVECGRCSLLFGFASATECDCDEDHYTAITSYSKCVDCPKGNHRQWPRPLCHKCNLSNYLCCH